MNVFYAFLYYIKYTKKFTLPCHMQNAMENACLFVCQKEDNLTSNTFIFEAKRNCRHPPYYYTSSTTLHSNNYEDVYTVWIYKCEVTTSKRKFKTLTNLILIRCWTIF